LTPWASAGAEDPQRDLVFKGPVISHRPSAAAPAPQRAGLGGCPDPADRRTYHRWFVCGLLFFATTINYIDRQIIGVLKPVLSTELRWSEIDYSNIVFAFQAAYAAGYALGGRFMDWVGVRWGYALAVVGWSLAAMGHGVVRSVLGFCTARCGLGLTEGANFPAAVKTVTEWFPRKERALATGIFNAGSNVGALITPLLAPWITLRWGWPAAFLVTGALGFLWVAGWVWLYRNPESHPRVSARELAWIRSEPPEPARNLPWLGLLRRRQTWAFVVGMFMTSPIWWFYLYWIPDFLHKRHGLDLVHLGPPLVVIYLMTDVGSIGGGWLSSHLLQRGWSVNAARKTALLVCALCVVPIFSASLIAHLWLAVLVVGLAASAHQGFSANLYTLVSDTVPKQAVSSVVGIGGMAGAIGGMFIAKLAGYVLEWTGNYLVLFVIASSAYLAALLIIHWLLPRLEPMELPAGASSAA
jgi:ACS family hexuronate transporter-like MFS transporter